MLANFPSDSQSVEYSILYIHLCVVKTWQMRDDWFHMGKMGIQNSTFQHSYFKCCTVWNSLTHLECSERSKSYTFLPHCIYIWTWVCNSVWSQQGCEMVSLNLFSLQSYLLFCYYVNWVQVVSNFAFFSSRGFKMQLTNTLNKWKSK